MDFQKDAEIDMVIEHGKGTFKNIKAANLTGHISNMVIEEINGDRGFSMMRYMDESASQRQTKRMTV
jgi:hypothetical protein